MSDKLNKSASITPPVSGQNTIVRAGSATAERVKLPASWRKSWITVQMDGVKGYFALGGPSIAADQTHTTTLTAEAPSAYGAGECQMVAEDDSVPVNLAEIEGGAPDDDYPDGAIYLSHIEASATGYIRIIRNSGPVKLS